ncbi:MAG: hypothetical protein WCA79_07590 [Anaerolineales bacterium]
MIGFVAVILVSVLIGVNIGLSRSVRGGGEFFVAWQGARGLLLGIVARVVSFFGNLPNFLRNPTASLTSQPEIANPYTVSIANQTQQLVYGRAAQPGENPYFLTIPLSLLPFYFPFALIADPSSVRGLWMFLNEGALLAITFLIVRLIEWSPRRLFVIAFFLLSIFSFYSTAALLDGSPVILLCLLYFGILLALQKGQDEVAGALLVLALFRWEVGLLFLTLVVWRVYYEKRSRVFYGFGMLMIVLLIVSFLMNPGWVIPFLQSSLTDLRADYGFTSSTILLRLWPAFNTHFLWIIPASLILLLGIEWYASRGRDFHHFIWTCCLTLAVTPLIGFRTELSNLVVLFPGLALIFATVVERWRHGYWLTGLLYLIVLLLPWGLFIRSVVFQNQFYQDLLSLFFPIFIIAGLYWTRWWFIRPPRTWLDYVRSSRS